MTKLHDRSASELDSLMARLEAAALREREGSTRSELDRVADYESRTLAAQHGSYAAALEAVRRSLEEVRASGAPLLS